MTLREPLNSIFLADTRVHTGLSWAGICFNCSNDSILQAFTNVKRGAFSKVIEEAEEIKTKTMPSSIKGDQDINK